MFYTLLVSHGEFAPGLHTAVKMIAGDNPNVMSTGLKDGMGADELAANVAQLVEKITPEDHLVVLADLMGGSPLTTTMNVIGEKGLLGSTKAYAGMSLPMALSVVLAGETMDWDSFTEALMDEAKAGIQEFVIADEDDDEEDL